MSSILTPLIAVFIIMLLGSIVQKLRFLPADTDLILNQFVYYIAFPAILLIVLAETRIEDIIQWGFIGGFSLAMIITYALVIAVSLWRKPKQQAVAAMRALNATFGNTAFIGIPLLSLLFPGNKIALVAAAIASLLSVFMFAFALVSIELASRDKKSTDHAIVIMANALCKNPIVLGSVIGISLSALHITLPESLALVLHQIGNTSSPCALFAIGMVLAKALRHQSFAKMFSLGLIIELSFINLLKLFVQPLIAFGLLKFFGVEHQLLIMGVLLAALPTAASVYLLAERYQINANGSAQGILYGTLITFISLPIIETLLKSIA
ncbi:MULTISPECIES: AEC family transporter [Shewanella]|jgi:predicted permease|uniref:AEC family transporter n=1 Tax=Shewanella TaxID=22 RepID=UPI000C429B81|nr:MULTISPECIES: AEC family transporter [Shewanella]NCQ45654.1 AEC family transporter [Shewanella frigidimarina]MBB1388710.1 AEC family transporter [Shewanella sp. SG44-6]NCO71791.1 AEC family transporter [Shewanella vesiculosa]NCP37702.1 AEC family transporter [Shewanella vesiculosa]NCP69432.1 AEC family transporter [Shewanella vesiculosa]|tara:strand:+ start:3688 stop:4656 length:969 start_codon:yes stop_codon:yes gene_type:complete